MAAANRGSPPEARGWLDRADQFHLTAVSLGQHQGTTEAWIFAHPQIVLKSFAAECYLKSLIKLETNEDPEHIHNLLELFDKLTLESKKRIQKMWDRTSKHILDSGRRKLREKGMRVPKTFRGAINESADAFLDWRYHGKDANLGFSMLSFPMCVRCRIMEVMPEWIFPPGHALAILNPDPEFVEGKKKKLRPVASRPAILNP